MSVIFDLPSGALIVWCVTVLAIAVYAAGPKRVAQAGAAHDHGAHRELESHS
jgi:zinc/manganese transport system permease protein